MKKFSVLILILLAQTSFFAVSCQEENTSDEAVETDVLSLSDVFGTAYTVPEIEGATQTRLAAGGDGSFHLVCLIPSKTENNQPVEGTLFYSRFQNEKWGTPLKIADLSSNQLPVHFADIAADSKGNAYIVWVNTVRNLFCSAKIEANNTIQVETLETRAALRAEVTVDANDVALALYRDKSPEENRLLSRAPEDTSWSIIGLTPDNENNNGQRQPAITAATNGTLYYGYRWMDGGAADRRVAFRMYDIENDTWGAEFKLTSPEKPWGPQLAVDAQHKLHMVWGAGYEPNVKTYYRAPDGKITGLGKGLGEKSWPPAIASTVSGKTIVAISEGEDYHSVVPAGKVFVYISTGEGFSDALPIDDEDHQGWGHLAYSSATDKLMLVWVAGGKVKYRITDKI